MKFIVLIILVTPHLPPNTAENFNTEYNNNQQWNEKYETMSYPGNTDPDEAFSRVCNETSLASISNQLEIIERKIQNRKSVCEALVGTSKLEICSAYEEYDTYYPKSCNEIQEYGGTETGLYQIRPKTNIKPFWVLCDMDVSGGGWTHIQKRFDGSQEFDLNWREYKFGFGNLKGEFWIGLENIYQITSSDKNELLIELTDHFGQKWYANYKQFAIGPVTYGYRLDVLGGYSGTTYVDMLVHHKGMKFTTKDLDQDEHTGNCAIHFGGGWWFKSCFWTCLNGKFVNIQLPKTYLTDPHKGIYWGFNNSCAGSRMLVRPVPF